MKISTRSRIARVAAVGILPLSLLLMGAEGCGGGTGTTRSANNSGTESCGSTPKTTRTPHKAKVTGGTDKRYGSDCEKRYYLKLKGSDGKDFLIGPVTKKVWDGCLDSEGETAIDGKC